MGKHTKKPCGTCLGHGTVPKHEIVDGKSKLTRVKCSACSGTGQA